MSTKTKRSTELNLIFFSKFKSSNNSCYLEEDLGYSTCCRNRLRISGLPQPSGKLKIELGFVLLVDDFKEDGIDDDVAVHVDVETVGPPEQPGRAAYVDGGVQDHLPSGYVGEEAGGVVRDEFEAVEPCRESEQLARLGGLGAGVDLGGAYQGAVVDDGHDGRRVLDGDKVGIRVVDSEDELGVDYGEVEFEGVEGNGDQMEGWIPWFPLYDRHRRRS
ncbi:hypothetical protein NE237_009281 [Protea cynaroides]|uniref:Uncharacterized protein n=1 Tax=Protea cynaroides TaxID=273540 RepID=A0A9Q0KYA9_9MAGN|nr:hypothetical protein NE237_009281 [Protea cynaroides]